MDLFLPKNNCSAKYIKFNEIKNKTFLDALSKSNARLDGNMKYFLYDLKLDKRIPKMSLRISLPKNYMVTYLPLFFYGKKSKLCTS